ncbi:T9SS type A sorting domain-containing protein [Flavobacterium sp.]|uniref:DUF7619 domain-containing protein n=1 Tax=Flavobacterium sp. TaxID=239 RepID=UPI0037505C16
MKNLSLLLLFLFTKVTNAQIVNIPDANFKSKLLEASPSNSIASNFSNNYFKIDSNNDGEIQISEANQVIGLDISLSNISSLEGVNNFLNLQSLYCNSNQLISFDVIGLINLTSLDCSNNQLIYLNENGLSNLSTLYCSNNQLTSLNVSGLYNLTSLNCVSNQLTSLDLSGLINLSNLNCGSNQLISLNVSGLTYLNSLYCNNNLLTNLDLSGLTYLNYLYCNYNQLISLNFDGLKNLVSLDCDNNQLTSLNLSGLTNLFYLHCFNNQLTSIDLSELININSIFCSNNQLASLNLSGLISIVELICYNNHLINIDVSDLTHLVYLNVNNNQLTSLNVKNGRMNISEFGSNPNLEYICADEGEITDIQNFLNTYGYTNCQVNSYCSFTPGGTFYTIQGNTKYDQNNNGCDATDIAFPNCQINITNSTISGSLFSNNSGNYSIPVQAGTHTLSPVFENSSYFNISPTSLTVTFPTQASPYVQDFCISANGIHNDLEITILPITLARPGFNATYKIIYKNKGTQTQSGTVNLLFEDSVLDFVSSNPTVSTQTLDNLNWNFNNLQPFESREILVDLNLNSPTETPALSSGDLLSYVAQVIGLTDETPLDNTASLRQEVVNALDPNDKTCLEGTTITPDKVGEYVHYMIRFENTGTANAQNIVVKDMIDTTKFDVSTLVPIDGSHSYVTRISETNKVEFIFENIQLPFDNVTNDGYVAFKIKTNPSLVLGDTFSNTASIYFDYNFPIITNNYTTTIAALSNSDFEFSTYFNLYPNPTKNTLNIQVKNTIEVSSISIYNTLGQLVLVIPNAKEVKTIDVSSLKTGTYFINLISDKGTSTAKFIKE